MAKKKNITTLLVNDILTLIIKKYIPVRYYRSLRATCKKFRSLISRSLFRCHDGCRGYCLEYIHQLVYHGDLALLKTIKKIPRDHNLLYTSIFYKQYAVFHYLLYHQKHYIPCSVVDVLIRQKDLRKLKEIFSLPHSKRTGRWELSQLVNTATSLSQISIVEFLLSQGAKVDLYDVALASTSSFEMFKWAEDHKCLHYIDMEPPFYYSLYCSVLDKGRLDILQYIWDKYLPPPQLILDDPCEIASCWDSNLNCDMLMWLHDEKGMPLKSTIVSAGVARLGDIKTMRWLRNHECPWNFNCYSEAANSGHLDMLKWLWDNGCPTEGDNGVVGNMAINSGDVEVVKFILEKGFILNHDALRHAGFSTRKMIMYLHEEVKCRWHPGITFGLMIEHDLDTFVWCVERGLPWTRKDITKNAQELDRREFIEWMEKASDYEGDFSWASTLTKAEFGMYF